MFAPRSPQPGGTRSVLRRRRVIAEHADGVLRVAVSHRAPAHVMRLVDQVLGDNSAGGAPTGIEFEFSGNLLRDHDADVIHLTDPSAVIGDTRISEAEAVRRAKRFIKRLKRRRTVLVQSRHSEDRRSEPIHLRATSLIDAATTAFIVLDPTAQLDPYGRTSFIPHSHLRDRYLGYPHRPAEAGRLLLVSASNFDDSYEPILKVIAASELKGITVRVVGAVRPSLEASFMRTWRRNPSAVSLESRSMSDAARVLEITGAEIVIVGSPHGLDSLATIMLALSLDRPVLVENTPATHSLAQEVGSEWIRLHSGPLTVETLEAHVRQLREAPPRGRPNLDARDPNTIARQYATVYRDAANR